MSGMHTAAQAERKMRRNNIYALHYGEAEGIR